MLPHCHLAIIPPSLMMWLKLLLFALITTTSSSSSHVEESHAIELAMKALEMAKAGSVSAYMGLEAQGGGGGPWADCLEMYDDSEDRLRRALAGGGGDPDDVLTWLSGALTSHATCIDGTRGSNSTLEGEEEVDALLREGLSIYARSRSQSRMEPKNATLAHSTPLGSTKLLELWNTSTWKADIVVAQDGTGDHKTISEALAALRGRQRGDGGRAVVYVKSGVYRENVEVDRNMRNVMFIGDGMDETVVTGSRSVDDGYTTFRSATFGVSGDGFWARDMTFENAAGPAKHQAVALRVGSDRSVFYRCSIKGYQDTLLAHSMRQFYRDCCIYGTIDFVFGNAAAVLQNCDVFVRKPLGGQANMVTAQGRDDMNQNTGISVDRSRVRPTEELSAKKGLFRSYLGRPWKKYSRTVFMKTELDGIIHPEGWAKWQGDFALDTLYYGEYMNSGDGAATGKRVSWPGFHVMTGDGEANPFSVESFIQGQSWIPETGVPFWPRI